MRGATWTMATLLGVAATIGASGVNAVDLHGLSPELKQKLARATTFSCDGGSKKLPVARLNDNYCDCDDGSDEPGTAACSHTDATFHCANVGYFSKNLPTSRVNDQICDCCDGSDEYASGTVCPITCQSLMDKFMAEKRGLLDVYEHGRAERDKLVNDAAELWKKDQEQLATLEKEVETLKRSVSQLEKVKEDEELVETKEKMERTKDIKRGMLKTLGLSDLSHEQLGFLVLELANLQYGKDEVLRLIKAERDGLGESQLELDEAEWKKRDEEREKETERINTLKEERRKEKEAKKKARDEAIERGETPAEEPEEEEVEIEVPPVEDRPVKKLFDQMSNFGSYEREQAKKARESYYDTNSKFSSSERNLRDLKESMAKSYGADNILYGLRDKCFETSGGQYKYSMCFFGKAKQDSTSLGEMQAYDAETNPNEVHFTGGTTCWNGPARSLKVTLECGAESQLYGVDEPSTCVYTAKLKTPVACDEAYKTKLLAGDDGDAGVSRTAHHVEVEVNATL